MVICILAEKTVPGLSDNGVIESMGVPHAIFMVRLETGDVEGHVPHPRLQRCPLPLGLQTEGNQCKSANLRRFMRSQMDQGKSDCHDLFTEMERGLKSTSAAVYYPYRQ